MASCSEFCMRPGRVSTWSKVVVKELLVESKARLIMGLTRGEIDTTLGVATAASLVSFFNEERAQAELPSWVHLQELWKHAQIAYLT